jgi:hypothetical protein
LVEICPILVLISLKKLSVKNSVKKIKEGMNKNKNLGLKYLTYNLNL